MQSLVVVLYAFEPMNSCKIYLLPLKCALSPYQALVDGFCNLLKCTQHTVDNSFENYRHVLLLQGRRNEFESSGSNIGILKN